VNLSDELKQSLKAILEREIGRECTSPELDAHALAIVRFVYSKLFADKEKL